ncbi:MAG: hypothetical protein ACOH1M_09020 [Rhodoglobus sp.]
MSDGDELRLPGFIAESDVLPPSKNLGLRLLGVLIGLGLLVGIAVAGGTALVTALWPDRENMCDSSSGPCSDVTVEQIAQFSSIALPATAIVDDAQYARVDNTGVLFATVVLDAGDADPLRSGDFRVAPTLPWVSEVDALGLLNVVLYEGTNSGSGTGSGDVYEAASGQRADGLTVILIRVSRAI